MLWLVLLLLSLTSNVDAWPACCLASPAEYRYGDRRLLTSFTISGGSIGGSQLEIASLIHEFEDLTIKTVLPDTWSDEQYNVNTSTIGAFAGCETRTLSGVVRSSQTTTPIVTFSGLLDLLGGSVAWSIGASRIFPGNHLWQQYLTRREGMATITGCFVHMCVFRGTLDNVPVDIVFSPLTAGIGLGAPLRSKCATLKISGSIDINIDVCEDRRVCRGTLCVSQTYFHDIDNETYFSRKIDPSTTVVVGFDMLEERPRDLLLYFTDTEFRVGFLYSSTWSWQTKTRELIITIILCLMAGVFIQRPLVVQLDSRRQRQFLVNLNMFSATFIVVIMFYRIKDIFDGISRSTGFRDIGNIALMAAAVTVMILQYLTIMYANIRLDPLSRERNSIIRLFFPPMLCSIFIMHHCGVTERDNQAFLSFAASLALLHTMPRILTDLYIVYGAVWPVLCGILYLVMLFPFAAIVGLQAAIGVLNIVDVSLMQTAFVFSVYIALSGIFVAWNATKDVDVLSDEKRKK